jgi:hypothetical protein
MFSFLRELFSFLSFFLLKCYLSCLLESYSTFFCFRIRCRIVQLFLYILFLIPFSSPFDSSKIVQPSFVFRLFKCCPTCRNCSKLSLGFRLFSLLMLFSSPFDSSKTVQLPFVFRLFKCCPTCRNCFKLSRL